LRVIQSPLGAWRDAVTPLTFAFENNEGRALSNFLTAGAFDD